MCIRDRHISCYGLKLEEGTPLYTARNTFSAADDEDVYKRQNVDTLVGFSYHGTEKNFLSMFAEEAVRQEQERAQPVAFL